jgi:hypothetical protein
VLRLDGALDGERAPMGKSKAVSSHRSPRNQDPESHAKTRRREEKEEGGEVVSRGGLGIEFRSCPRRFVAVRVSWSAPAGRSFGWEESASMGKSQAVSSHRSPRNQDPT